MHPGLSRLAWASHSSDIHCTRICSRFSYPTARISSKVEIQELMGGKSRSAPSAGKSNEWANYLIVNLFSVCFQFLKSFKHFLQTFPTNKLYKHVLETKWPAAWNPQTKKPLIPWVGMLARVRTKALRGACPGEEDTALPKVAWTILSKSARAASPASLNFLKIGSAGWSPFAAIARASASKAWQRKWVANP